MELRQGRAVAEGQVNLSPNSQGGLVSAATPALSDGVRRGIYAGSMAASVSISVMKRAINAAHASPFSGRS